MDFIETYNLNGIIIGLISFLIIGVFHPLVIKGEYYFGIKFWIVFLLSGILTSILSVIVSNLLISIALGVFGFACFWSIKEMFEQVDRVKEGRFPKNPKRKYNF